MKEYQVKNLNAIEPQINDRGVGNVFSVKPATDRTVMERCQASFVEVEPGNTAFGYHYHESVEEIFYVISGEGSVRTHDGEVAVKAGDLISLPTGVGGSHVIRNTSASEKLVYIDYGTTSTCEIAHLPDAGKILVASGTTFGIFDEPKA